MSLRDYEQGVGFMVDSNRLTVAQRSELAKLLPARHSADQAERFLVRVSEDVAVWEGITEDGASESDMVLQLEQVQGSVLRLAQSLDRLDRLTLEHVAGHFDALVWSTDMEPALPANLRRDKPLFAEWLREQVQCLRNLAAVMNHAQGNIQPSTVSRTTRQRRSLVSMVVWTHQDVFGRRPGKSDWFYTFMAELGMMIGMPLGKSLVNTVLSNPKN